MTQVEFHVLPATQQSQRFACGLIAELRQEGRRVHVHANSRAHAEALDNLLWTFRDISFLPHSLQDEPEASGAPITIGWDEQVETGDRVLVNLADEVPNFAAACTQVVELVPDGEAEKERARARFRRYRELGFAPQMRNAGS